MIMSPFLFGTLKYFINYEVHVENLHTLNMGTVRALVKRGYLIRKGTRIQVTKLGLDSYSDFVKASPNMRKNQDLPISEMVADLLRIRDLSIRRIA